jgi:hypothetical protein
MISSVSFTFIHYSRRFAMKSVSVVLCILFLIAVSTGSIPAQIKIGADIYSRYIWRGVDYGNAPSFQPAISYANNGFSIGTWGAYSIGSNSVDLTTGSASVFAEHDIWASYGFNVGSGSLTFSFTDYFYPSAGLKLFNYNDAGGSHVLEIGAGYSGGDAFPISLATFYNFFNDADRSVYFQASYPFALERGTMTLFAAGTPARSAWYASTGAAIINAGLTYSTSVPITEHFNLPVNASYIINPHIEQSYLIFGISL